jgi:hypothetical protein
MHNRLALTPQFQVCTASKGQVEFQRESFPFDICGSGPGISSRLDIGRRATTGSSQGTGDIKETE